MYVLPIRYSEIPAHHVQKCTCRAVNTVHNVTCHIRCGALPIPGFGYQASIGHIR